MTTPIVTEITPAPEPTTRDDFAGRTQSPPAPEASRHFRSPAIGE